MVYGEIQALGALLSEKRDGMPTITHNILYEPMYKVTYVYEGEFKIEKKYPISVDPSAVGVIINNKEIKIEKPQQQAQPGFFATGSQSQVQIDGLERVIKKTEKIAHYNSKMQETNLDTYLHGRELVKFDKTSKKDPRDLLVTADISAKQFKNKVTNDLLTRPNIYKSCVSEKLKISADVIYYPKYRLQCKNSRTGEQKILVFSAVDGNNIQENF